tara:strand:- start:84 stop:227 length:144 start_codon:yes stop_codon:yes gene_type:complete
MTNPPLLQDHLILETIEAAVEGTMLQMVMPLPFLYRFLLLQLSQSFE